MPLEVLSSQLSPKGGRAPGASQRPKSSPAHKVERKIPSSVGALGSRNDPDRLQGGTPSLSLDRELHWVAAAVEGGLSNEEIPAASE